MSSAPPLTNLMTTEQMLALPENGYDRDLIRGELREFPMTRRNQWHSSVEPRIAYLITRWLDSQPGSGSRVTSGEAGFRLRRNPDTTVGIDVAYVSAEVVANTPPTAPYFEGPPILAIEILSPSDSLKDIWEKIGVYKETGVLLIWIVDPIAQTVTVHHPDAAPEFFNIHQNLSAEPHLPGFLVPVSEIFRF